MQYLEWKEVSRKKSKYEMSARSLTLEIGKETKLESIVRQQK